MWSLHFAYPIVLYTLFPLLVVLMWYRKKYYQAPVYSYSLTGTLFKKSLVTSMWRSTFFEVYRFFGLVGLALLIARPQLEDSESKIMVEGIDILLVLDVSGSMQLFDDEHTQKQRIEIAKEEAIKFIEKRQNDPIGLVLFGNEAVSRCPLTLDKTVLKDIVNDIELGVIDPRGTVISKSLITALNRLRKSESATKIIILLTDGEPTETDLHPDDAVTLAQKYGVKIYTIGIGGKHGGFFHHPLYGLQSGGMPLDTKLIKFFAQKTGGRAFMASNQQELKTIYDTIDQLEKSEYQTDMYHNYYDTFMPFLWALALYFVIGIILATVVWFGL